MKPLKDTKVGIWVKEHAPNLIDIVDDFVPAPIKGGLNILKNMISKDENLTPEQKSEFDALCVAHEEFLIEEETKRMALAFADTKDARDANVKIQESDKASWLSKNVGYILDLFVGLIWGTLTIYLVAKAMKLIAGGATDLTGVLSLYSTVTAVFMIIIGFHRGTSRGSERKSEEMNKMYEKK